MRCRQRWWTSLFRSGAGVALVLLAAGACAAGTRAADPSAPAASAAATSAADAAAPMVQPEARPPATPAPAPDDASDDATDRWSLLTSVEGADVAVFVRQGRRLAVVRGDAVADTHWRLESVGDDAIMLTTDQAQTGAQLEMPLRAGEPVPPVPAPAVVGADAVPVPSIRLIDAPKPAQPP